MSARKRERGVDRRRETEKNGGERVRYMETEKEREKEKGQKERKRDKGR